MCTSDRIGSECHTSPKGRVGGHQCPPPEGGRFHTAVPRMYSSSGGLVRAQPDSVVGVDVIIVLNGSASKDGACVARRPFGKTRTQCPQALW